MPSQFNMKEKYKFITLTGEKSQLSRYRKSSQNLISIHYNYSANRKQTTYLTEIIFIKLPVDCTILDYEILFSPRLKENNYFYPTPSQRSQPVQEVYNVYVYAQVFIYPMKVGKEVSRQWGRSKFICPSRLKCNWRFPYRGASIVVPFHKPPGIHQVPERVSTKC